MLESLIMKVKWQHITYNSYGKKTHFCLNLVQFGELVDQIILYDRFSVLSSDHNPSYIHSHKRTFFDNSRSTCDIAKKHWPSQQNFHINTFRSKLQSSVASAHAGPLRRVRLCRAIVRNLKRLLETYLGTLWKVNWWHHF